MILSDAEVIRQASQHWPQHAGRGRVHCPTCGQEGFSLGHWTAAHLMHVRCGLCERWITRKGIRGHTTRMHGAGHHVTISDHQATPKGWLPSTGEHLMPAPEPMLDPNNPGGDLGYGIVKTHPCKLYVPVFAFNRSYVRVRDMAWSLCHQPRCNGHSASSIMVGEHCMGVADRLPLTLKLEGLFHDGAECYISDLVRPLKHHEKFGFYLELEESIERVLFPALGMRWPLPAAVKDADNAQLRHEIEFLRDDESRPEPNPRLLYEAFLAMARPLLEERGLNAKQIQEIW